MESIKLTQKSLLVTLTLLLLLPIISTAKDSKEKSFVVSKNGVVAYTWNANPTAKESILTTSVYTFNNGHAVTRTRKSPGVYNVNFEKLSCDRGQFIVNAYGGTDFKMCRIGAWGGEKNCDVSVYCFNANGEALDSQFNLLFVD